MKKKRILFAAVDVGYRMGLYSKFLNDNYSNQIHADTLSTYMSPKNHYRTSYTYEYPFHSKSSMYRWCRSFLNFILALFRYDILHFISGETLLTRKLRGFELKIYKLLGKRIIMHFVGSDIRNPYYIQWKEKNINQFLQGDAKFQKTLSWQDKLIFDAEKYADSVLVSTPDLLELISKAVYYPVVLDLNKYLSELNGIKHQRKISDEIVILHAPSNSKLKGTKYIHEILKKIALNSNNKIKVVLTAENDYKDKPVSRYELFKLYKESDIVIDQLIIGWYGLQSIEALAAGKHVISYVDANLNSFLYPDCPLELADKNTLEHVVLNVIEKILKRKHTNSASQIDWLKKYHTIENNNDVLVKAWGL
jgi:hypothetical protein